MGKNLTIKNADFSKNAINTIAWIETPLYGYPIYTNPAGQTFGQQYKASAQAPYTRNRNSISVPNGKKLTWCVVQMSTGILQKCTKNSVSYNVEINGDIPSVFTAESLYFGGSDYALFNSYTNNTGHSLNYVTSFGIEGKTDADYSGFIMRYFIEDAT